MSFQLFCFSARQHANCSKWNINLSSSELKTYVCRVIKVLHLQSHCSTSHLIMHLSLFPEFCCFKSFFTEMRKVALSPEKFWNGLFFLNLESFNLTFTVCLRVRTELVGFIKQSPEVSSWRSSTCSTLLKVFPLLLCLYEVSGEHQLSV